MKKPRMIPGPNHPITIVPTGARVVVRANDRVIAATERALTLSEAGYPPVQYVPLADVEASVLRPSDSRTYCPFKGEASYYSLVVAGREIKDAIWIYRTPFDAVGAIADHVAFYRDRVQVSVG